MDQFVISKEVSPSLVVRSPFEAYSAWVIHCRSLPLTISTSCGILSVYSFPFFCHWLVSLVLDRRYELDLLCNRGFPLFSNRFLFAGTTYFTVISSQPKCGFFFFSLAIQCLLDSKDLWQEDDTDSRS